MGERRGQVWVVTGASAGVGRAIARAAGAEGARVGLIARGIEGLRAAADEIREAGGEALVLPLDVADAASVDYAADLVVRHWGRIDVWVNDAMVTVLAPAAQTTPEEYARVMEVNYLGTVHGTLAALRHMKARDAGTILQIGSALAYRSIPLQSAYCASKAAARAFTDSLRSELRHDRSAVRLCMLQLPAVNTPQFDVMRNRLENRSQPVPPIFQPEVIARVVLDAADHPSRERWIAGSTVLAILAQKVAPGIADRWLARTGFDAQQTDEPLPPRPVDNLWTPLPGDRGAHGRFDARAKDRSAFAWLRMRRAALGGGIAAIAAGMAALSSMTGRGVRRA